MDFKLLVTAQDVYLYDAFSYHFRPFGNQVDVQMTHFQILDDYDYLVSPAMKTFKNLLHAYKMEQELLKNMKK